MAGSSRDPQPGSEGFDPYRRKREIEAMEQRFRERAERQVGGRAAAGEMDARVSNEMEQFFSESAQKLQQVVPGLDESPGGGMKETTGEIRRKIDDFFAQVKEAGGGEVSLNTQELTKRRSKWAGFFPGDAPGGRAPSAPGSAPAQAPMSSPMSSPIRRTAPPEPAPQASRPYGSPSQAAPAPAAAPHAPPARPASLTPSGRDSETDRPKMDLKTALERLKRQNVVRDEPAVPADPRPSEPPAPQRVPSQRVPSQPTPSQASPTPRPAPAAARPIRAAGTMPGTISSPGTGPAGAHAPQGGMQDDAARPTFAPRRDPTRTSLPSIRRDVEVDHARPPRRDPTFTGLPPVRKDGGPVLLPPRRDPTRNFSPPASQSQVGAPLRRDPTRNFTPPAHASQVGDAPTHAETQSRTDAPPAQPGPSARPAQPGAPSGLPPRREGSRIYAPQTSPVAGTGLPPRREPTQVPARREPSQQLPRPAVQPGADIRDRLRPSNQPIQAPSVRPGVAAGRGAAPLNRRVDASPVDRQIPRREDELPPPPQPRKAESPIRVAQPRRLVPADAPPAEHATEFADGPAAQSPGEKVVEFDNIFNELEGLVRDTLKDSVDESFEAARGAEPDLRSANRAMPPRSAPDTRTEAPDPRGFARPADDEEPEDAEAPEAAPGTPYDWGVRKSARPPGAWLVEGEEGGLEKAKAARAAAQPASAEAAPSVAARVPAAPAADAPPAPSLAGGGGVGGRSYLVKKLTEEVQKLAPAVAALEAKGHVSKADLGAAPAAAPSGKDDMVSVDQFAERAPVDLEKELSPVRLVEELRRIRRLVDALLAKGLITQADFEKSEEDD